MTYPATRETFALQFNMGEPGATNATAEFINTVTRLLTAVQDKAGIDTDVAATGTGPTAGSLESRMKRVENATGFTRTITGTRPTVGVAPGNEWFDSTSHPWIFKIFTGGPDNSGWDFIGANAVQIQGRNVDTATPTDQQALIWDATLGKITYGSVTLPAGMRNPLVNAGDMVIGGTPSSGVAPFAQLAVGGETAFLQIVSGLPSWQTPSWINTSVLTTRGDLVVASSTGSATAIPTGGTTAAGRVLAVDGTGYPVWTTGYMTNPMVGTNDLIIGGALGAPAALTGGALEANNSKVLTLQPNTPGSPPLLGWDYPHPADTTGDLVYGIGSHQLQRLGIGAAGYVLTSVAGVPAWSPIPAAGGGSGIGGVTIKDEGATQGTAGTITTLDFVGAGVSASVTGSVATITVAGGGSGGAGTVTSVGLSLPSIFNVTGSPVTGTGTLIAALATQTAARFFAGPISGTAAAPAFRSIIPTDLPLFIASGASHAAGIVPDPGSTAGAARFLCENGGWAVPPMASGAITVQDEGGTTAVAAVLNFVGPRVVAAVVSGTATITCSDPPNATTSNAGLLPTPDGDVHHVFRGNATWGALATFGVGIDGLVPGPGTSSTVQFLRADGAWATPAGGGGGSGDATSIQSVAVSATAPTTGQVLEYNGTLWLPMTPSGGGGGGGLLDFMATIVPPVLTSLVKVNENVSVPYTQVGNTVVIAAGQIESFVNIRLLVAPSTHTHWHFRAAVLPSVGFGAIDVLLLDSTNSYRCYGLRISGLGGLNAYQWSFVSPTSNDRNVGGTNAIIPTTPLWLHASWDGTTMRVGLSADGLNPTFIFGADPASVGWPSGHTPTSFGIGIEGLSALNNSYASIISWEEIALP